MIADPALAAETHTCNRGAALDCSRVIKPFEVHLRLRIQLVTGENMEQRYCTACCADPELAILFADVCNTPVKKMEVFMVYR